MIVELAQVRVNNPHPASLKLLPHLAHRIMRRTPLAIPKAAVQKLRLKDRLHPLNQRLLANPIENGRNA